MRDGVIAEPHQHQRRQRHAEKTDQLRKFALLAGCFGGGCCWCCSWCLPMHESLVRVIIGNTMLGALQPLEPFYFVYTRFSVVTRRPRNLWQLGAVPKGCIIILDDGPRGGI